MASRKTKPKKTPEEPKGSCIEQISGCHPIMGNRYQLSRYDSGEIRIEREELISHHPLTGAQERKTFEVLIEKFELHERLWSTIQQNPCSDD